jgi:hypothetical protein
MPPKKSHKLRKGVLIGGGVFVALGIVLSLTGSPDDENSVATTPSTSAGANETPAPAEPASDVAPMGSAVRDGKFEFQVTNVTTAKTVSDPTNNPYMTANAQGEFIVATLQVHDSMMSDGVKVALA